MECKYFPPTPRQPGEQEEKQATSHCAQLLPLPLLSRNSALAVWAAPVKEGLQGATNLGSAWFM